MLKSVQNLDLDDGYAVIYTCEDLYILQYIRRFPQ